MTRKPTLVLLTAALSRNLLHSGACPRLEAFAEGRCERVIRPVLPAVTQSMQATFLTGAPPAKHGIVGNGFYDRTFQEHRFWNASAALLDRPPFWAEGPGSDLSVASLFWWSCRGAPGLDTYLNVAPFHLAGGETVSSCYSEPAGLYEELLEPRLGPFPLHRFWGPGVSIESSAWILEAALAVLQQRKPDLLLVYLPQMDYAPQRSGPGSKETLQDLADLDALLTPVMQRCEAGKLELILLSEYGITEVEDAATPNRALREAGLFRVRRCRKRTVPDLPGSRAFVLTDHQVGHVYVRDPQDQHLVKDVLQEVDGVDRVLNRKDLSGAGLDHPRSGELMLLARPERWIAYPWWSDPAEAPDWAFTVDIHSKIGYDPLELIFDPDTQGLARDCARIRGSHGLIPEHREALPILVLPASFETMLDADRAVPAESVKDLMLKALASDDKSR